MDLKFLVGVFLAAILTENYILNKFLGICPFLGVSKKLNTAVGMSCAVTAVMVIATAVTWPVYTYVLVPNDLSYLQTIVFILIIAALVQLLEIMMRKYMPPLYNALSMTGVLFILYLGGARVQSGAWDIAAFTTFIACFAKLSVKSSKAAKLFNAVQQAQVSWRRIKGFLCTPPEEQDLPQKVPCCVKAIGLSVPDVLENANFEIEPGQIIGITGPVACGKSMLGKAFLCENPYEGSIWFDNRELASLDETERCAYIGYLGHDTELLSDTVENNILLGGTGDVKALLRAVRLEREVTPETRIGAGGMRLSGGQQQRLALARQLANLKPLLILDDPFSALDRRTEREVFDELRKKAKDSAVLLISHRLYVFPELDGVLWMQNGVVRTSTHAELMDSCPEYAELYKLQQGGQESA